MSPEHEFRTGVVKPIECIQEGWTLIKDQYWLFIGIVLVGMLIGGAVPIVLMGPMMVGIYICFIRKMRGEKIEFGTLFKGFDHFVPALIATLIQMAPVIVVMIPAYLIMVALFVAIAPHGGGMSQEDGSGFVAIFMVFYFAMICMIMIISILVGIFFMFVFPLIADRRLSGLDAVKLSMRAGKANFGGVLGLLLMNAVISFAGALACYVGAFFVVPIAFAANAAAYRRVFPDVAPAYPMPPPPPASWA